MNAKEMIGEMLAERLRGNGDWLAVDTRADSGIHIITKAQLPEQLKLELSILCPKEYPLHFKIWGGKDMTDSLDDPQLSFKFSYKKSTYPMTKTSCT